MNWDQFRRNGMNASRTIDLCKAFDAIYSLAPGTKRDMAHRRLKECERLQEVASRQVAAAVISGTAFALGLESE